MGTDSWLKYPDSITERLIEKAGEASLVVLFQGIVEPTAREMKILNVEAQTPLPSSRAARGISDCTAVLHPEISCGARDDLNGGVQEIWRREIMMSAHGEACWYARTIAPLSTVEHCADFFAELKTKYLGELVFHSPIVERLLLTDYQIDATTAEYQWLPKAIRTAQNNPLYARMSHYELHQKHSFYLVEIFSQAVEKY